jgi:hypothetical protein
VVEEGREVKREVKKAREVQREQTNQRAAEKNGALQVENKRRQSGRWHKNYYGQWEKWTGREQEVKRV